MSVLQLARPHDEAVVDLKQAFAGAQVAARAQALARFYILD